MSDQTTCPAVPAKLTFASLAADLTEPGYSFIDSASAMSLLSQVNRQTIAEDPRFLDSWNSLEVDPYMADGGKYRKRRHATYAVMNATERAQLMPYQPHYQTVDYNPLNGGVARYFAPILDDLHQSLALPALLEFGNQLFTQISANACWHIELHQFRIEVRDGQLGKPTPEGVHRDGVDFVIVMMIKRVNINSGSTTLYNLDHQLVGEFMLRDPFDMVLVSDRQVYHGVTPIEQIDPALEAYRDVLVMTFKKREG